MNSKRETIRLTIVGAGGRMADAMTRALPNAPNVRITGAIARAGNPAVGRDLGELAGMAPLGVRITSDLQPALADSDVVVDFSRAAATLGILATCRAARKPLLIATTGLPPEFEREFDSAAREIPLLVAPNTSLGATLLMELVRATASALSRDFDVEIIETHDRQMQVAPSGTSFALGRVVAETRGQDINQVAVTERRAGRRGEGVIGISVVRAHDIVGDHTVMFAGPGEQIVLTHRATDYAIFPRGTYQAAVWLSSKPAGRYRMRSVVGYEA